MLKKIIKKVWPFLVYLGFYLTLFSLIGHLGNYWDWFFPYFREHLSNFFRNESLSLNDINFGTPMGYSANYIFRGLVSLLGLLRIEPEYILETLLVATFTLGSLGVSKLLININKSIRNDPEGKLSWYSQVFVVVLSIMAFINPAIFYKLLAGHLYYLFSFTCFVWLVYFLLFEYKPNLNSSLILAMIFSFIGIQFQFFIFAFIVMLVYFLIWRDKFNWKHISLIGITFILINLPWLSNFLVGANSVSSLSQSAGNVAFADSSFANPIWIALMVFSKATLIKYFFSKYLFVFFGLVFALIVVLSSRRLHDIFKNKIVLFLGVNFTLFFILGTGFFHELPIPFVKTLYPIFREIGHFAPIIILLEFLFVYALLSTFKTEAIKTSLLIFYGVVFVVVNSLVFVKNLPKINYSDARNIFAQFNHFNSTDSSSYRILTYPFWNQYGFKSQSDIYIKDKLINNSGWDSFTGFSGREAISQYVPPQGFTDSIQYKLLSSQSLSDLEKRNVKYLYDFSNIYESNYEKYTDPATYNNDLSLIKSDKNFIKSLVQANPDSLKKVGDNIYELTNTMPRIFSGSKTTFKKVNATTYTVKIENLHKTEDLIFLDNFNSKWGLYLNKRSSLLSCEVSSYNGNYQTRECEGEKSGLSVKELSFLGKNKVFDQTHSIAFDYANKWAIDPEYIKKNMNDSYYTKNADGSINIEMTIFFQPQAYFVLSNIIALLTFISVFIFIFSREIKTLFRFAEKKIAKR